MQDKEKKEEKKVQGQHQEQQQTVKKEEKKVDHKNNKPEDKKGFFKKKEDEEKKKLENEIASLKDKNLRIQAEMQNMRRRMEEEKANLLKYEGEDLIIKLLPTLDNFERAIKMAGPFDSDLSMN